jgi:hypothetical protein
MPVEGGKHSFLDMFPVSVKNSFYPQYQFTFSVCLRGLLGARMCGRNSGRLAMRIYGSAACIFAVGCSPRGARTFDRGALFESATILDCAAFVCFIRKIFVACSCIQLLSFHASKQ